MSQDRYPQAFRPAPAGAALAVLLAALIALWAPPRADAAAGVPKTFFGVSGRHLDNQDFEDLETAGVGTYRTLINFRYVKRRPSGGYDWRQTDRLVGRMASRDVRLLPMIYGAPSWIYQDRTVPPIFDPRARLAWTRLLTALVDRYGPRGDFWRMNPLVPYHPVTTWQIWNEPNSSAYWAPGPPSPGEYARLLKLSAFAIHRLDPHATIVSAGLVADPKSLGSIPGPEYLSALAAIPAVRETVDKYGYHPYARSAPGVVSELSDARRALRAQGEGTAPIWVTEFGWGSVSILDELLTKTRQGQATALTNAYRSVLAKRRKLGIERMLWYYWRDHGDPFCIWCRSAGLVERSRERKPSFVAFRSLTGS